LTGSNPRYHPISDFRGKETDLSTVRRTLGRAKRGVFREIKDRVVWPSLSAFRHWRTRVYFVSYPKLGRTWLRAMVG